MNRPCLVIVSDNAEHEDLVLKVDVAFLEAMLPEWTLYSSTTQNGLRGIEHV